MLIVVCDAHWGTAGFFRVVLSRGSGGCGELSAQDQHRWEERGEGVFEKSGSFGRKLWHFAKKSTTF